MRSIVSFNKKIRRIPKIDILAIDEVQDMTEGLFMFVYKFLKEPIQRAFGEEFFEILEDYNSKR